MSSISIHLHRRYQSGARVSMLIPPLREKFPWQHKHMSNFEPSYHSFIRRALGDQWFSKHLQLCQNTLEHRKREKKQVERLEELGSHIIQSLDLKPLELLVCNEKNDVPGSKSKPVGPKSFIECKKPLMFPHL